MPRTIWKTTLLGALGILVFNTPVLARTVSITLGDIDGGVYDGPGSIDEVYSDLDWRQALFATGLPSQPFVGFDFNRTDVQVPFTFDFVLDPGEVVVDAILTLAIRGTISHVSTDVLLLDDVSNIYNYDQIGWNPVSLSVVSERSVDLSNVNSDFLIPTLQDGRLNVAVRDDTLVDYARLELTIYELLAGDLDGDGFVGINDLGLVLSNWNANVTTGDPLSGDPSGDGLVGIEDLNFVLGNWNAGVPPPQAADGSAVIPEPGVWVLMAVGSAAGLWMRGVKSRT